MPSSPRLPSVRRPSLRPILCKASLGILSALTGVCSVHHASGTTYYWDANSATAGSGATPTGTWGGASDSGFWSTDSTGSTATSATGPGTSDIADFTAFSTTGTNPSGGYVVTIGAAQSVNGIIIGNTNDTSTGTDGTLTLAAGTFGLTIGAGGVTLNNSSGDPSITGNVVLGADQTWTINNAHVINSSAAFSGNATSGTTRIWTLGNVGAFTPTLSGVISDGTAGGNLSLTVNNTASASTGTSTAFGGGTWYLSNNANSFTGAINVARGNLQFTSIANLGTNSSLGAPTTAANGTISLGSTTFNGAMSYNGSAASTTNRIINLAGTSGNGILYNNAGSAANTLTFTSDLSNTVAGAKSFVLRGSNTGNNAFNGAIGDSTAGGALTLSKQDAGTWILGGANTYTGGTAIGGGTLSVASTGTLGANVTGNNVTISGGNLLLSAASNYGANQNVTVNSGGIGVGYTPASLPTITDNTGTAGGIYGINYTGTGAVTSQASGSLYNGNWFLGSFTGGTYTGTSLGAGNAISGSASGATGAYRLGGGGGTLTFQNAGLLSGNNDLLVGNNASGGNVILPSGNTFTGATTLQNGTLTISSLNKVTGGTASSSLGAPTTVASGTIGIGAGSNVVTLNYTGGGETTDRVLNFAGTTGTVTIQNSGTGALAFNSVATFTGVGAKTLVLGTATDTFGGTLGPITNTTSSNVVTVTKNGLTDSTWNLAGTNTYTGTTLITGGVLSMSAAPAGYINLNGANSTTQLAVLQTAGMFTTRTLSTTAATTNLNWQSNSGFAAVGGRLTLTFNAGATLTWGANGFMGTGTNPMVYGSNTANNQVELTNNFTFGDNVSSGFNRTIFVDAGAGGDSALLSGVISVGGGTSALNGFTKTGGGTLVLSNLNTYTGTTGVGAGTLVAMNNAPSGAAGAFGNATTAITLGLGNINGSDGTVATNASPSLAIGGAYNVARPVTIANLATTGTYSVGGSTDNAAAFSGLITASQNFSVTQVATSGANALTLSGGITGGATATTKTVTFNNVGAVNVTTVGIADGAGGGKLALTKLNSGVLTLAATNTFTGAATVGAVLSGTPASARANGGTLSAASAGALGSVTSITINNGGTMLLNAVTPNPNATDAANRISDTAPISLGSAGGTGGIGGTILRGAYVSEGTGSTLGMGALTLASSSTLDFGSTTAGQLGTLRFTTFTPAGFTLNILNYVDHSVVAGVEGVDDRLIFGADQLSNLGLFSFNGTAAAEVDLGGGLFEIVPMAVPVPEPATWVGGCATLLVLGFHLRRRAGARRA